MTHSQTGRRKVLAHSGCRSFELIGGLAEVVRCGPPTDEWADVVGADAVVAVCVGIREDIVEPALIEISWVCVSVSLNSLSIAEQTVVVLVEFVDECVTGVVDVGLALGQKRNDPSELFDGDLAIFVRFRQIPVPGNRQA